MEYKKQYEEFKKETLHFINDVLIDMTNDEINDEIEAGTFLSAYKLNDGSLMIDLDTHEMMMNWSLKFKEQTEAFLEIGNKYRKENKEIKTAIGFNDLYEYDFYEALDPDERGEFSLLYFKITVSFCILYKEEITENEDVKALFDINLKV